MRPGRGIRDGIGPAVKKFKIKKLQVFCIAAGVALYAILEITDGGDGFLLSGNRINRNGHGQGDERYEVLVDGLEQNEVAVAVSVGEKIYTQEEADHIFEIVISGLGERILGENSSLEEVRKDLNLISGIEEYGIRIRWETEDASLLDSFGTVYNQKAHKKGTEIVLKALLTDGIHEKDGDFLVKVYPPVLTAGEEMIAEFQSAVETIDRIQRTEESLVLPEEYKGMELRYRTGASSDHRIMLVLGILLAALCSIKDQVKERQATKCRQQQLLLDYSEILSKLMIFISAGMTVRLAWERITEDYEKGVKQKRRPVRYAYEEMSRTMYQLKSGTPESQAYSAFGRKCGLQPYRKLISLLEQNRRTGTKNLRDMLQAELASAFEQRKNLAKRLGEEAGTKLLLPLFMMLGIVMVMIVVPAFLSFY